MVSAARRYHCLSTVTIIGAFLHIGSPPIESPHLLTSPEKMSCRNTKKPIKAKWLLGEECAENVGVEWKGRVPQMSWIMNDKIKRWRITWQDSTPTNMLVSLGINGDLRSALMMSHGMTLLGLREVHDDFFPFALAALVAVHPIRAGDGEDDYVAVVLDATLCHMEMCVGAQERGL